MLPSPSLMQRIYLFEQNYLISSWSGPADVGMEKGLGRTTPEILRRIFLTQFEFDKSIINILRLLPRLYAQRCHQA